MKRRWGKVTAIFLTILMAAGLSACGASKQQMKGEKEETEVQKRAELTVLAAARYDGCHAGDWRSLSEGTSGHFIYLSV